jgi:hypothetical protein
MQTQQPSHETAQATAPTKLVFKKETLRQLTSQELRRVAGGGCGMSTITK